jgi:polysaccharide export outer membrane protein
MTTLLRRAILAGLAFLVSAATLAASPRQDGQQGGQGQQDAQQGQPDAQYVVGPQDVLVVTLWDQTELSGKYTIQEDGTFTFPLVGRVQAAGLTLRAVEDALKARLKEGFFKQPQLSVGVEQYRSQRIFVVGEVRQPGMYPLAGQMTIMEALSRAGSTTPDAKGEVLVVRSGSRARAVSGPVLPDQAAPSEVVTIDLRDLESGLLAHTVTLLDGDTVVVPRAESVFVFGQVRSPGAYAVRKDTTLLQALSLAGGLTDRGASGRIKVVRVIGGEEQEIKLKLNDPVLPGDTIVVPEKYF